MKLTLVTSPHVRHGAVLQNDFRPHSSAMYTFAPLGLLSLAAVVNRDRPAVTTELYDLNRKVIDGKFPLDSGFYDAVAADIFTSSPDVVGFMTECDSYHHVLQICERLKKHDSKVVVILGGPHASAVAQKTLERWTCVDGIVIGEGEDTICELLDSIAGVHQGPVSGTLLRKTLLLSAVPDASCAQIIEGGPRSLITDLDDLPIPKYSLHSAVEGEELFLEVGRGCPFRCEFCSTAPFWQRKHRVKSAGRIVEELRAILNLFGPRRVHFTHDLFTVHRDWVISLCDALISACLPVTWTCSARIDTVDAALLKQMAAAGCAAIYFGIESGSDRILREINKHISAESSFRTLRTCREVGITPNAGFIAGFPTEDEESLSETFAAFEKALRVGCRPTHIFGYCPFAASSLYSKLSQVRCGGHFLDIPLGHEQDFANRRLVSRDRDLFGSYFRPVFAKWPESEDLVNAVDEFSPLVEAYLSPTLALAESIGGMFKVYREWVTWIKRLNSGRNAQPFRLGYGTPVMFASFVREYLKCIADIPLSVWAVADALDIHLRVLESTSGTQAISMASYRSVAALSQSSDISIKSSVSLGDVVASFATGYDVVPAILSNDIRSPIRKETFLVWQRHSASIRLLKVNREVYQLIENLTKQRKASTVGALLLDQLSLHGVSPISFDVPAFFSTLSDAADQSLVTIQS